MSNQRDLTVTRLLRAPIAPAMHQLLSLAKAEGTRFLGDSPSSMIAGQAFRIWSVRLQNAEAAQTLPEGLPALVAALRTIPPDQFVEQVTLKQGRTTAVIFLSHIEETLIGAVITERTAEDDRRAEANLARAQKASPLARASRGKVGELERATA